jgi:hypothetical protein
MAAFDEFIPIENKPSFAMWADMEATRTILPGVPRATACLANVREHTK